MAYNETNPFLEILKSYNLGNLVLAFCLSMLVGLVIGALIYILLTWASRRTASARISGRRSKRKGGASRSQNPMNAMGLYRSTFLSVYRQPSVEPVGPLGAKPSSEASTFRPLKPKGSRAGAPRLEAEGGDAEVLLPEDTIATPTTSDSVALVPNKRHSFFLGGNGLKGFLPTQTPPPAYDSVIHAFEETCT